MLIALELLDDSSEDEVADLIRYQKRLYIQVQREKLERENYKKEVLEKLKDMTITSFDPLFKNDNN
jgi:hypothetical protein